MKVTVLGAGVSGLTTANVLQCAGHEVQVVAEQRGLDATSGAAGAMWLPIRLPPNSREFAWALRGYGMLRELAATTPEAGVDDVTACEVVEGDGRPWWADHVDDAREVSLAGVYPHAASTWAFTAPRMEPAVYIPWLESQLEWPIEQRRVSRLQDLDGDVIVNCTGIGSMQLCHDAELTPVFGQTVIVEPGNLPLDVMLGDERDPEAIFYSIPRRAEVVLGGCRTPMSSAVLPEADDALTEAILARTRAAGYELGTVLRVRCGMRPVRPHPRVEREGCVVHNYGHGGSGFALSWGAAEEVLRLVEDG
jgi:D-amino-acid oxidase